MLYKVFYRFVANITEYTLALLTFQSVLLPLLHVDFTAIEKWTLRTKFEVDPFYVFIAVFLNNFRSNFIWK